MTIRITLVVLLALIVSPWPAVATPVFQEEPVVGDVELPEGHGLLAAVGIGLRISAPSLHLKDTAKFSELSLPSYPTGLLNSGITGKCVILFELEEDGSVTHVRVAHSPNPEFGHEAVAAVKRWRLQPLEKLSGPKTLTVTAVFVFSIYNE